ncbi:Tudor/PWWP/MBT superfamily protein [Striga asiatica]|uniref:Tudor/PWWP/MBT superfamily protein n=1 Tax=Striga asiatica TaxID=4170 RepID=A0A5A7PKE0_STRAF|nr:Tudor/PWWP/MBT superfamily protein [Striga asiatica]
MLDVFEPFLSTSHATKTQPSYLERTVRLHGCLKCARLRCRIRRLIWLNNCITAIFYLLLTGEKMVTFEAIGVFQDQIYAQQGQVPWRAFPNTVHDPSHQLSDTGIFCVHHLSIPITASVALTLYNHFSDMSHSSVHSPVQVPTVSPTTPNRSSDVLHAFSESISDNDPSAYPDEFPISGGFGYGHFVGRCSFEFCNTVRVAG